MASAMAEGPAAASGSSDELFVETILAEGLVSQEILSSARRRQAELASRGDTVSVADILVRERILTQVDVERHEGRTRFGRYHLVRVLGHGAMGIVHEAWDPELRRSVAIKRILPGRSSPRHLDRFLHEAKAAARVRHPGLVPIYEAGREEGEPWYAMELVQARPLDRAVALPAEPGEAARIVRAVAEALHAAHGHGVVHRDVKPANILIDDEGRPRVTDFGLARFDDGASRITQSGALVGTPAYMSPEQVGGDSSVVGPASDQFSLGVILYELLTGRLPFDSGMAGGLFFAIVSRDPASPRSVDPEVPAGIESICLRALAKDEFDRYPDLGAMAADLGRYLQGKSIAGPPAPDRVVWRRSALAFAGAFAFVLGLGLVWSVLVVRRPGGELLGEAEGLREAGRLEEAREAYLAVLAADPGHEDARAGLAGVEAVLARRREDVVRATEEIGAARSILERLALRCHRADAPPGLVAEQAAQARERAQRAVALAPDLAEAAWVLGRTWAEVGRFDRAGEAWSRALELAPGHVASRLALGRALLVQALLVQEVRVAAGVGAASRRGQALCERAAAELALALAGEMPEDSAAEVDLARAFLAGARDDWATAASLAADGAERYRTQPAEEDFLWFLGLASISVGDPARGRVACDRALAIRPVHPMATFVRGMNRFLQSDDAGAIEDLGRTIELWPEFAPAWFHRAIARDDAGDDAGALEDLAAARRLDGTDPRVHDLAARILLAAGRKNEAMAELDRALELDPEHFVTWWIRALAFEEAGDVGAARDALERALSIAPDFALALSARGRLRFVAGDVAGAIDDLDRCLALCPTLTRGFTTRARVRWELRDVQGTMADCDRALELGGPEPNALYLRAMAFLSRGRIEEAEADLVAAGRADPLPDVRRQIEEALRTVRARR